MTFTVKPWITTSNQIYKAYVVTEILKSGGIKLLSLEFVIISFTSVVRMQISWPEKKKKISNEIKLTLTKTIRAEPTKLQYQFEKKI